MSFHSKPFASWLTLVWLSMLIALSCGTAYADSFSSKAGREIKFIYNYRSIQQTGAVPPLFPAGATPLPQSGLSWSVAAYELADPKSARIYTEDNRTYKIRFYSCEFDGFEPGQLSNGFASFIRAPHVLRNGEQVPVAAPFTLILTNAHRWQLAGQENFNCDGYKNSYIVAYFYKYQSNSAAGDYVNDFRNGYTLKLVEYEFSLAQNCHVVMIDEGSYIFSKPRRYQDQCVAGYRPTLAFVYDMNQDWFTPSESKSLRDGAINKTPDYLDDAAKAIGSLISRLRK
ncbi:MAG: hypothetical protein ACXU8O_04310 [Asticcacaulis sp.]